MQSQIQFFLKLIILSTLVSCSTSKNPFFAKRSPHEKYSDGIINTGMARTQLGAAWFAAANKSLVQPEVVGLPYKVTGYFAAERPSSSGYLFSAKRGEKIVVYLYTLPAAGYLFFAEIWQPALGSGKPTLLTTMDTLSRQLEYIVKKDGPYLLRLQPELLRSVEYTVTISTTASLAFPVDRSGDPKLISLWGVARDGGARTHEGVDIGAKFRTPVLASANGNITKVSENEIGGKVVFLDDANTGNSIYYAHLDYQSVRQGQTVRAGDVIGLIGNTGNARNTVPHLHFGIYTNNGAIDPQAFIDQRRNEPKAVTAPTQQLNKWLRTTVAASIYERPSAQSVVLTKTSTGDAMLILAATDNWYNVKLPGGEEGYIISSMLTNKLLRKQKTTVETRLLDTPYLNAPALKTIPRDNHIDIIGTYNNFFLVAHNNLQGWVMNQ